MKTYIGTKIIEAKPAIRMGHPTGACSFIDTSDEYACKTCEDLVENNGYTREDGYKVRYADGYEIWYPKDVFEAAYHPVTGMSFGQAIEAMKVGEKVAREGWSGKNQYIELASAISYKNPEGAVVNAEHSAIGNQAVAFCGTSGVQMGWLASQADMLAEDWGIVE